MKFLKRLYLLRHAKAENELPGQADIERHLHKQGIRDAEKLSEIITSKSYFPSHIFTSPANRTIETAEILLKAFDQCEFIIERSLYNGDIDDIINLCFNFEENVKAALVVFHNPGITYFANVICDANIENVPTCGLLVMEIDVDIWKNIDPSKIRLLDFIKP